MQSPLKVLKKTKGVVNEVLLGSNLFENLGLKYNGPLDGHDVLKLVEILQGYKNNPSSHPVLFHVVTQKGKGYKPAEDAGDNFHGVSKFSIETENRINHQKLVIHHVLLRSL